MCCRSTLGLPVAARRRVQESRQRLAGRRTNAVAQDYDVCHLTDCVVLVAVGVGHTWPTHFATALAAAAFDDAFVAVA